MSKQSLNTSKDSDNGKDGMKQSAGPTNSLWEQLSKQKSMQLRRSDQHNMSYNLALKGNLRSLSTSMLPSPAGPIQRKLKMEYSISTKRYMVNSNLLTPQQFIRTKESFNFQQFNPRLEFLDQLGLSHVRISEPDKNSELTVEGRIPISSAIKKVTRLFTNEAEHLLDLPFIKMKIKSLDDIKPRIQIARNQRILNIINVEYLDLIVTQRGAAGAGSSNGFSGRNMVQLTIDAQAIIKLGLDTIQVYCNTTLENDSEYIEFKTKPGKPWLKPFGIDCIMLPNMKVRVGLTAPFQLDMDGEIVIGAFTLQSKKDGGGVIGPDSSESIKAQCEIIMDEFNNKHALITFASSEFTLYKLFKSFRCMGMTGQNKTLFEACEVNRATFNIAPMSGVKIRGINVAGGLEADLEFKFLGLFAKGRLKVHKANVSLEAHLTKLQIPGVIDFTNKDVLLDGPQLTIKIQAKPEVRKGQDEYQTIEYVDVPTYVPEIRMDGRVMVPDINRSIFDAVGLMTMNIVQTDKGNSGHGLSHYGSQGQLGVMTSGSNQSGYEGLVIGASNVVLDKQQAFRSNVEIQLGDFQGEGVGNEFKFVAIISQDYDKLIKPTIERLQDLAADGIKPLRDEKDQLKTKYKALQDQRREYEKLMIDKNHEMEEMSRQLDHDKYSRKMESTESREQQQLKILEALQQDKQALIEQANMEKIQNLEESEKQMTEWKELMIWGKEQSEQEFNSFSANVNKNLDKADAELLQLKSIIQDRKEAPWYDAQKQTELTDLYPEYVNSRAEKMQVKEGALEKLYYARLIHFENMETLQKEYKHSIKTEKQRIAKVNYQIDFDLAEEIVALEKAVKVNIDNFFKIWQKDKIQMGEEIKEEQKYHKILRQELVEKQREELKEMEKALKEQEERADTTFKRCNISTKILENWRNMHVFQVQIETQLGSNQGILFSVQLSFLSKTQLQERTRNQSEDLYHSSRQVDEFQLLFDKFPTLQLFSEKLAQQIYDKLNQQVEEELQQLQKEKTSTK